jgi:outer membrane lipoprotein carrier protein
MSMIAVFTGNPAAGRSPRLSAWLFCIVYVLLGFITPSGLQKAALAEEITDVIAGLENRYAAIETAAGNFRQTYRAPGIEQEESGEFWLKKPGLMRWEYRIPEEKLFVADGRESFLYVPADNQVQVQSFSTADLLNTPLAILLGMEDINRRFIVSRETAAGPPPGDTLPMRLTPRDFEEGYVYLLLSLDKATYEIRRVVIHEHGGNTSEFLFSDVVTNVKVDDNKFRFRPPRGVEVLRLDINN